MKSNILSTIIMIIALSNGHALIDNHETTVESYLNDLTNGTSSFLVEKGKSKDLYLPQKAVDNDINTAWVEGNPDDGIGEFLIINITRMRIASTLKILPGFARNNTLYLNNNRPKDIRLIFFQCSDIVFDSLKSINNFSKKEINVIFDVRHKLIDSREYQTIILPNYRPHYNKYPNIRMALIIDSVYKGIKHSDTCISELRFIDKDGVDIVKSRTDNIELKHKGSN